MTTSPGVTECDLVDLSVTESFTHFPGLTTERVQSFESLDPMRLAALLEAAETAHFFTWAVGDTPTPPDACTCRTLAIPEQFATPGLVMLIRLTCRTRRDQQMLTAETMTDEDEARIISSLYIEEEIRTSHWSWPQD